MVTISRVILLIGVVLILLAAFGVQFGPADLFQVGVAFAFAAGLVP